MWVLVFVTAVVVVRLFAGNVVGFDKTPRSVLVLGVGVFALIFLALSLVVVRFKAAGGNFVLAVYRRFLWPPLLVIVPGAFGVWPGHSGPDSEVERGLCELSALHQS